MVNFVSTTSARESRLRYRSERADGLHRNHAEALEKTFSSAFDLEFSVEPQPSSLLLPRICIRVSQRLCLISAK